MEKLDQSLISRLFMQQPASRKTIRRPLYFNSVRNWAYLDFACLGRYNTVFQDYLNQNGVKITIHPEDQALMTSAFPDFVAMNFYTTVTKLNSQRWKET